MYKMHKIKEIYGVPLTSSPAAVSTIKAHFKDTGLPTDYYDLVLTGDLGVLGKELALDMLKDENVDFGKRYDDCGCMIFDTKKQDMHSGGSGCGCCAAVFSAYIMKKLKSKELKKILLVPTGALLSTTSTLQGESIPSVAHAVSIEGV